MSSFRITSCREFPTFEHWRGRFRRRSSTHQLLIADFLIVDCAVVWVLFQSTISNSLMLDLQKYSCLGAALRDALDRFAGETCLIEADRDREKVRLTYSDFKEVALPLARALEDAEFDAGDRAAILMTNQSKWLISAYAIFFTGGVLVPLDYKLTAGEQLQLLDHSKAKFLVVEYYLWRAIAQAKGFENLGARAVLVTEAP